MEKISMRFGLVVIFLLILCLPQRIYAQGAPGSLNFGLSGAISTPARVTSTYTPDLNAGNIFVIALSASCASSACIIANPTNISLRVGSMGMFHLVQPASGGPVTVTWGSNYIAVGGTAGIALSTVANTVDYIPFEVATTGIVVLGGIVKGPIH